MSWLVKYRLGGREAPKLYGGAFKSKALATERRRVIEADLAALRLPTLALPEPATVKLSPTLNELAGRWQASRVDVAAGTGATYTVNLNRILPRLGTRRIDTITTADVADLVAALHAGDEGEGRKPLSRESIRKTRSTLAQVLDFGGVNPNPASDTKAVKLPREEPTQIDPPGADDIEVVLRLLPSKCVLPVLWLDWSAHRVTAGIDKATVGDWDVARSRVRARAETTKTRQAHWREVPAALAEAIERSLPPRDDRDLAAPLFPGVTSTTLRTAIGRACRATGRPLWSPHDLKHRRISLLHAQGKKWAEIGELIGNRSIQLLAQTYTHVLMDERELDYAALIAELLLPEGSCGSHGALTGALTVGDHAPGTA